MLANSSILSVEEELRLFPSGNVPSFLGRLGLGRMNRARPLGALTDHSPPFLPGLDVHRGFLRHVRPLPFGLAAKNGNRRLSRIAHGLKALLLVTVRAWILTL